MIRFRSRTHKSDPSDLPAGGSLVVVALLLAGAACGPSQPEFGALESYREARAIVSRGLEAIGGADAVTQAGGVVVESEGEYDLGVRLQGLRPGAGETYPVRERLGVVPGSRAVYESRGAINADADEWIRHDVRMDGSYWMGMAEGWVFPSPGRDRARYERLVPHLLLQEALAAGESLRSHGRVATERGPREAVSFRSSDDVTLTLLFDPSSGRLQEISYLGDLPLRGDTRIRWSYDEYQAVDGLGHYPAGYTIDLNGERMRELRHTRIAAGTDSDIFDVPDGMDLPPLPEAGSGGPSGGDGPDSDFRIQEVAPGVHLFVNLRGGFHMLFVEFEDWVLAVDAPTEWNELHQLPGTTPGDGGSQALSLRYLAGIRSVVPDKPVRYVAVTHPHSDHAGGVRAFVDAGATVVGTEATQEVVEHAVAQPYTLGGYPAGDLPTLSYEVVDGVHTIQDASMEVQLIDVGENPHSVGMLAVYLPLQEVLYVSDLFDPAGPANFPSPSRVPVMRWFVDWLDRSGLEPDQIFAVHGTARVTEAQLETIRTLD